MPCANTYRYALARLSSQQLNAILAAWFVRQEAQRRCGDEPSRLAAQPGERQGHVAIDGKVLKGTGKQAYGGDEPQQPVLHVYEVQIGMVLEPCPIGEKHNEESALKPLPTPVLCTGRILTKASTASRWCMAGRATPPSGVLPNGSLA
jgi:hypothetical protein